MIRLRQQELRSHFATVMVAITIVAVAAFALRTIEASFVEAHATTLPEEQPDIRVGLYPTDDAVRVRCSGAYRVMSGGNELFKRPAESSVKLRAVDGSYVARVGTAVRRSAKPIRLVPTKPAQTICTILNYENRPTWNTELNDNAFRGILELHHAEATGSTWVIEELPLEQYLYGVAETSNTAPRAFAKALIAAERTYALYHIQTNTKHAAEYFHVGATSADQVYRGYGYEQRSPRIRQFVDETRGKIVTYEGDLAITPYFSRSDGRTRSWDEVWAGSAKPWLVSVPDPCCTSYDGLFGHGVGMSAQGALWFATEKDWNWKRILTYYYTDSAIADLY